MSDYSNEDRFQFWLTDMDEAIERFVQSAPERTRSRLNHSAQSLDALEEWVLSKYPSPEQARPLSEASFIDGAARYFGEVLRKATHSKWSIRFDQPSYVFHGIPVLIGGKLGHMPCCPITTVTASIDRRTGRYFSTILRNLSQ